MQFFGFKNAFSQRLLREFVANVGGTTEQSSSPTNLLTEPSDTVYGIQCTESNKYPDLQPYLEKLQVTGKRSRRDKSINIKLLTEANSKQRQPQNCMQNADASNSRQKDQRNLNGCSPST